MALLRELLASGSDDGDAVRTAICAAIAAAETSAEVSAPLQIEELVDLTYGEVEYWPEVAAALVTKAHAWVMAGKGGAAEVLDVTIQLCSAEPARLFRPDLGTEWDKPLFMSGARTRHDDVLAMIDAGSPSTAAAALMLLACLRPSASVGADALARSSAIRDKLDRDPGADQAAQAVAAIASAIIVRAIGDGDAIARSWARDCAASGGLGAVAAVVSAALLGDALSASDWEVIEVALGSTRPLPLGFGWSFVGETRATEFDLALQPCHVASGEAPSSLVDVLIALGETRIDVADPLLHLAFEAAGGARPVSPFPAAMLTALQRRAIAAFGRPMLDQEHRRMQAWGIGGPDDIGRFLEGRTTHFAVHPPTRQLPTPWHLGLVWYCALRPEQTWYPSVSIEDTAEMLAGSIESVELVKELCCKGRQARVADDASGTDWEADEQVVVATVRRLAAAHPPAPIVAQLLECLEDPSRYSEGTTRAALRTISPDVAKAFCVKNE